MKKMIYAAMGIFIFLVSFPVFSESSCPTGQHWDSNQSTCLSDNQDQGRFGILSENNPGTSSINPPRNGLGTTDSASTSDQSLFNTGTNLGTTPGTFSSPGNLGTSSTGSLSSRNATSGVPGGSSPSLSGTSSSASAAGSRGNAGGSSGGSAH